MSPTITLEAESKDTGILETDKQNAETGGIRVLLYLSRAGLGGEQYAWASAYAHGANVAPTTSAEPEDDDDGLHIAPDISLSYVDAVAMGRRLVQQIPDDLIDADLGPDI